MLGWLGGSDDMKKLLFNIFGVFFLLTPFWMFVAYLVLTAPCWYLVLISFGIPISVGLLIAFGIWLLDKGS